MTPDGVRYMAMGAGQRVPLPFHLRWLAPFACRANVARWLAIHVTSIVACVLLAGVWWHQLGLTPVQIAAGVVIAAALPSISGYLDRPVLVDLPATALTLGVLVTLHAGWWPAAVVLALLAGATKEQSPLMAAAMSWSPIPLVGLLPVAVRLVVQRHGVELADAAVPMEPARLRWPRGRWLDPAHMLFPWGCFLAAAGHPSWALLAAVALGYGGVAAVAAFGMPMWTSTLDTARVYQGSWPIVGFAAMKVIPLELLPVLVAAMVYAAYRDRTNRPAVTNPVAPVVADPLDVSPSAELPSIGCVTPGWCSPGKVDVEFMVSMLATLHHDNGHRRVLRWPPAQIIGGPRLHVLRDGVVRQFLAGSGEWLWFVDTDMDFDETALYELLDVADPITAPIVGGLCFGTSPVGGQLFPTIFRRVGDRLHPVLDYDRDVVNDCDGTGLAFVLIHRSVFERMLLAFGRHADGDVSLQPWFPDGEANGVMVEGDLAFCYRALALGIPVKVHAGVKVRHKKIQYLDEGFYDHVRATQAALTGGAR